MPKIKVKGQTVQPGEHGQTNGQTLPNLLSSRFAVNNQNKIFGDKEIFQKV